MGASASIKGRKKPSRDAIHYLAINELDLAYALLSLVGSILGTLLLPVHFVIALLPPTPLSFDSPEHSQIPLWGNLAEGAVKRPL